MSNRQRIKRSGTGDGRVTKKVTVKSKIKVYLDLNGNKKTMRRESSWNY